MTWSLVDKTKCDYVPRCSYCGKFKPELFKHRFFTGIYCREDIQDILYNNVWNIEEVNEHGFFVWEFHSHESWRKEK